MSSVGDTSSLATHASGLGTGHFSSVGRPLDTDAGHGSGLQFVDPLMVTDLRPSGPAAGTYNRKRSSSSKEPSPARSLVGRSRYFTNPIFGLSSKQVPMSIRGLVRDRSNSGGARRFALKQN